MTSNRIIFKTPAHKIRSSTRFSWDKKQTAIFSEYVKDHPFRAQGHIRDKFVNEVIQQLGFSDLLDVINVDGDKLEHIIRVKVIRKLKQTAQGRNRGYDTDDEGGGVDGDEKPVLPRKPTTLKTAQARSPRVKAEDSRPPGIKELMSLPPAPSSSLGMARLLSLPPTPSVLPGIARPSAAVTPRPTRAAARNARNKWVVPSSPDDSGYEDSDEESEPGPSRSRRRPREKPFVGIVWPHTREEEQSTHLHPATKSEILQQPTADDYLRIKEELDQVRTEMEAMRLGARNEANEFRAVPTSKTRPLRSSVPTRSAIATSLPPFARQLKTSKDADEWDQVLQQSFGRPGGGSRDMTRRRK